MIEKYSFCGVIKRWLMAGNRTFICFLAVLVVMMPVSLFAQRSNALSRCKAGLIGDSLVIENDVIKRVFLWNNGRLITTSVVNKVTNKTWAFSSTSIQHPGDKNNTSVLVKPDFQIPGLVSGNEKGDIVLREIEQTNSTPAHLQVQVTIAEGDLSIKRIFRLYPGCPAIACDYYLKGKARGWNAVVTAAADMRTIESEAAKKEGNAEVVILDRLQLPGRHWKATSVEFFDVTDRNNTLLNEYRQTVYVQESRMKGNLLLLQQEPEEDGFFLLKEAPVSNVQLNYPGFDFTLKTGDIKMAGLGIHSSDLNDSTWIRGYSAVTGVSLGSGEFGLLSAIKSYQQNLRIFKPGREQMIMSNTWGDRGQDSKINERFVLAELTAGAKLGITHFQIDDGWQTGRSSNSVFQGGSLKSIWRNVNYWEPDPVKFPNGFKPVIDLGKRLGIEISTWFNPSIDSNFKYWQKDADVLINQFQKYGIRTWKIDGVNIANKQSEINFRKLLDKVVLGTNNEAVFDLDVTGGRRFGYHYFYEYGNLFLENRYTDFSSYYPYYTLRNLWMLSKYVPAQRLQIEFLNKRRNRDKYPLNDVLAPDNYSFDYLFAITMFAQPLAWFENSNLPVEAFKTAALINTYKQHWGKIHSGKIFPVGKEPDGFSWSGFQSVLNDKTGYFLVFRDHHSSNEQSLSTYIPPGKSVYFKHIAGSGKSFSQIAAAGGNILFELAAIKSFVLYAYEIR